jgi:hypothetical protein
LFLFFLFTPNFASFILKKSKGEEKDEKSELDEKESSSDKTESVPSTSGDLSEQLSPVVPKDYELYLNLVEFARRFLLLPLQITVVFADSSSSSSSSSVSSLDAPTRIGNWMQSWVLLFAREFIELSTQYPLVSGE